MKSAITYYRVSTVRQSESGLGLEAQKDAVTRFVEAYGYVLCDEFIEIESGSKNNRPVLHEALKACKEKQATLLIAKLDRLARNVAFISQLMEAGVDFKAVDNPHAEKFMIHVIASFSEYERDQISIRTKNALRAAKARGIELGYHGRHVLSKENKRNAIEFALTLKPIIEKLNDKGITSVRAITKALNKRRIRTATGGKWYISTVHKLLQRIKDN